MTSEGEYIMKFKVGDKVKVVRTDNKNKMKHIGSILTIIDIDEKCLFPYRVLEMLWIWRDSELALVDFTKADLKDGMVVEYRNGDRAMVLGDKLMRNAHYTVLNNFTDTLEHLNVDNLTIIRAYQSKADILDDYFNDEYLTLVWERDSAKEMTVAEIEKELGYKIKVIGEK